MVITDQGHHRSLTKGPGVTTVANGILTGEVLPIQEEVSIEVQDGDGTTENALTKASMLISDINITRIAKQKVQRFKAGQIEKNVHEWELLTSDHEIVKRINHNS